MPVLCNNSPHLLQLEKSPSSSTAINKESESGGFLLQGIFPDQGPNPSLPHWQADSLPLSHPEGSPLISYSNSISKVSFFAFSPCWSARTARPVTCGFCLSMFSSVTFLHPLLTTWLYPVPSVLSQKTNKRTHETSIHRFSHIVGNSLFLFSSVSEHYTSAPKNVL